MKQRGIVNLIVTLNSLEQIYSTKILGRDGGIMG